MLVTVPEGITTGQALYVSTPDGREIVVLTPEGVESGQELEVCLVDAITVDEYERALAEEEA